MAVFEKIVPFTKSAEGGLSRATTDTASKNASPCVYKGKTGWHTNEGITYSTFRSSSKSIGYDPTCDNFISMPDSIWIPIAKKHYWDLLDLDNYHSQAIANLMFSWEWGSGNSWENRIQRYLKSKGITWNKNDFKALRIAMNGLTDFNEQKTVDELFDQKKQFLESLHQPTYTQGWLDRLSRLKQMSASEIGKKAITHGASFAKHHIPAIVIGVSLLSVSLFLLFRKPKK